MSRRTGWARAATVVGGLGLATGAATTLARSLPPPPGLAGDTWAMATSFTGFGVWAYAVAVLGLLGATALRRRPARLVAALLAVALAAVHLSWVVPAFVADDRAPLGPGRLRVYAQNMLFGGADPASVVATARDADVLVLTEITTSAAARLDRAGIGASQPYQAGGTLPTGGAGGTRLYSRFPVRVSHQLAQPLGGTDWVVRVDVPDVGLVTVVGVHPPRPVRGGSDWLEHQQQLRRLVPRERTVVAGDFNAVDSHPGLRGFRADGFRDSDELVGAGWQPTYPAEGPVPPLIGIDHVLVSPDLTATASRTVSTPGTDHRGVLAAVALAAA